MIVEVINGTIVKNIHYNFDLLTFEFLTEDNEHNYD